MREDKLRLEFSCNCSSALKAGLYLTQGDIYILFNVVSLALWVSILVKIILITSLHGLQLSPFLAWLALVLGCESLDTLCLTLPRRVISSCSVICTMCFVDLFIDVSILQLCFVFTNNYTNEFQGHFNFSPFYKMPPK